MPIEVNFEKLNKPLTAISNTGNTINMQKESSKYKIKSENFEENYEISIIYYKGYKAILTFDNKKIDLPLEKSQNGLLNIQIPSNSKSGTLCIWYNGTIIQKVSYVISIFTFLGLIIFAFFKQKAESSSSY